MNNEVTAKYRIDNEVTAKYRIDIESDYSKKDKPPFPPKIRFFIYIPYFKYFPFQIMDNLCNSLVIGSKMIREKTFGFSISYNDGININREVEFYLYDLNERFHLGINEKEIANRIKNLYNNYFKFGEIHVKNTEKMTISQEYINDRIAEGEVY